MNWVQGWQRYKYRLLCDVKQRIGGAKRVYGKGLFTKEVKHPWTLHRKAQSKPKSS